MGGAVGVMVSSRFRRCLKSFEGMVAKAAPQGALRVERRPRVAAVLLVGAVGVTGLAGCASSSADAAAGAAAGAPAAVAAAKAPGSTPATRASTSATGTPDPTGTAKPPPDQLAAALPSVVRPTKAGQPARIKASAAPFTGTVAFGDGVRVKVTSVKQGASTGQGPGVFSGAPRTAVGVQIVNGTKQSLDLSRVVVTMTYGTPKRVASPVYEVGAVDFAGILAAGASANATYMYSIPTGSLSNVTMAVDFDGGHAAATFTGAVKK
jgi:hypothetical protein